MVGLPKAANAVFVGAKTVNGPSPLKVVSSSASFSASTNLLKSVVAAANCTTLNRTLFGGASTALMM